MKQKYDVIIIGAGPAGLECASQLKNSKLSVLLIEKNKTIGPKICAGGLTHLDSGFDIPLAKTRAFANQEIFVSGKKYEITLANPLRTISRADLGQYQLSKIRGSKNIALLKETSVNAIEKDRIVTGKGTFYFKMLVGADGSNSIVRKHLGLKSVSCMGLYCDIPKVTDRFIWNYRQGALKSGYIWVFPHKDSTNIGIYFNPENIAPKAAKEILKEYLIENKYDFSKSAFYGAHINYAYQGCVFGNIFLAGDAAGLACKMTGEGISFALASGKDIGMKILCPKYDMKSVENILIIKRRRERMLAVLEAFPFLQGFFIACFARLVKYRWFQRYFGN